MDATATGLIHLLSAGGPHGHRFRRHGQAPFNSVEWVLGRTDEGLNIRPPPLSVTGVIARIRRPTGATDTNIDMTTDLVMPSFLNRTSWGRDTREPRTDSEPAPSFACLRQPGIVGFAQLLQYYIMGLSRAIIPT